MKSFKEIYEKFKCNKTDAAVARKANLNKTTLSRIIRESIPANRNYLWCLCFALELNLMQSKELFASAGLWMNSSYHLSDQEKEREEFLKECINQKQYNIIKINIQLFEKGHILLGNKSDTQHTRQE